jgi:hypothetical protein
MKTRSTEREDLVHMGTSALITFKILKILKSYTSIFSKIMLLNIYIDIHKMSVCEKVPKKYVIFRKI